jgi:protein O-mannosyl-transferase
VVVARFAERDRLRFWSPIVVALVAIAAYATATANGFVLDDQGVVVDNPLVRHPADAWRAFLGPYWPAALGGGQYRPLGILAFATDWALSGGDARWFHLVNVLWHAAASLLVCVLAAELLAPAAALAAGLLFAVHPVHVEAVANTVGRLECMAAVFVLGALLAHRRARAFAPALFALALLSKEGAVVFVGLALANDLILDEGIAALRRRRWLYAAYAAIVVAFVAAVLVVFRGAPIGTEARALAGATTGERLLTVASVIPHYARLLVAPFALSADYEPGVIPLATGLGGGAVLGLVLLAALIGFIAWAWRRAPVLAVAAIWIPIALAPVSNVFFTSGVILAERTLYLASVGAVLALGWMLERAAARDAWRARALAGAAILAIVFGARVWTRIPAWRDNRAYLMTLLTDHPESYRAHFMAGRVHRAAGRLDAADTELTIAYRIFPRDTALVRTLADVARQRGDAARAAALLGVGQ